MKSLAYAQVVGHVIRTMREEAGITLADMAKHMGYNDKSGWSRIETADTQLTATSLLRVALKLQKKPHQLIRAADDLADKLRRRDIRVVAEPTEPATMAWALAQLCSPP